MKEYIQALTRISNEAYNAFYFENAGSFLDAYYQDKDVTLLLMESKAFWAWWKQQFENIDEEFAMKFAASSSPSHILLNVWKQDHSPERMVVYPGAHIIEDAMNKVWKGAWKEEHVLNHEKTKAK